MKIGFFIRSLNGGGAEKVAIQLVDIWTGLGHDVFIFTTKPSLEREFVCNHAVCEKVSLSAIGNLGEFSSLKARHGLDVVVFNDAINGEWFSDAVLSAKEIGLHTIIINHHTANSWLYCCHNTSELFMDEVFRKADVMVCVDKIWALWWKYRGVNSVFIQNPVSVQSTNLNNLSGVTGTLKLVENVDKAVELIKGKKNIVWVGRVDDKLKRPELAIEVFAKKLLVEMFDIGVLKTKENFLGSRLTMLGRCSKVTEKYLRGYFAKMLSSYATVPNIADISDYAVKNCLLFPGFVTNVEEYLKKSDVQIFTSATEVTVPQVILEALVLGVETVAFDIPVLRSVIGELSFENNIDEKWHMVLSGEEVKCDFDTPEVRLRLMDELHFSQQWFSKKHLPELCKYRSLRDRINLRYIVNRAISKIRMFCK